VSGSPVVRITVASPVPVIRVAAPTMPAVVRVQSLGTQGPAGQQGIQGSPGDYGAIRYDEVNATPYNLVPGVPAPFTLAAPVTNTNSLRGPFANFVFLSSDGRTLHARANGDVYLIRARLGVVSSIAGGSFATDLVIPGVSITSSTRTRSLLKPAGTSEIVDELFEAFPGANFVINNAMIMLTSSVPVIVTPQTLFVKPLTAV
jgi:hypothetical protein